MQCNSHLKPLEGWHGPCFRLCSMWPLQLPKIEAGRGEDATSKDYFMHLGNSRFIKQACGRWVNGESHSNEIKGKGVLEGGDMAATE